MSRKIILIKQELLLLVYELNRSGLLAENEKIRPRSEERFSRNAETDLVCRLLLEKKNNNFLSLIPIDAQYGPQAARIDETYNVRLHVDDVSVGYPMGCVL